MKIHEFARGYCSNILRVVSSQSVYEQLAAQDDFPFDDIRIGEDGTPTKVVFIDDNERFIDIYELMSYDREDIIRTKDVDLIQVYDNYMGLLDTEDVKIADTVHLAREWRALREKEEQNVGLLS